MDRGAVRYVRTHEWVRMEGDVATIGITDFAVRQLTDLVHVELPDVGKSLSAGQEFGVVESVKAASDLYAPLAGTVVEVNEQLPEDLGLLSEDPFGRGWMVRLRVSDPSAVGKLMDQAAYQAHCESEAH